MSNLFVWKEQLQTLYARHSKLIDKAIQFCLALLTFITINNNVGYMKLAANPVIAIALAVICAFLPPVFTVLAGAALMLAHMFALSMGVCIITAAIYLIMFVFYFRFAPGRALIVLLVPVAFLFKVPYLIPIAYGLIGSPICIIPITFGTIIYFMITYVKAAAPAITNASDLVGQMSLFAQQILQNKEMWVTIIAFTICLLVVYAIHRQSADHAWKIAIIAGAIINIVVISVGAVTLNISTSYGTLFFGSVLSVGLALILEFFVFSVDYSRSERLQYEDDEYYYYVKAIPKISVAAPEKTVKRINERQDTEAIDAAGVREEAKRRGTGGKRRVSGARPQVRRSTANGQRPQARSRSTQRETDPDAILLEKSLRDELDL